jgi:SARP family transcriptional regulator, regulator of embCAB operon
MDVKVLGPLEARENGRCVMPSAAKPRQVLALLALRAGHVVPVPTIIEELWGENPPRSALTTLQTYIMQLRRLIAAALGDDAGLSAKDVLHTRFGGYQLDIPADHVDAHGFERLALAGQRQFDLGDHASTARLLRTALEVWRGPALVDVSVGMPLATEATRLEELRLGALETRIEADLRLGRHQSLISELSVLTAAHPMNENICAKSMIALYRSGRQWKALEAYSSLRDTLVGELGVDPSVHLRRLQQMVLRSDSALGGPGGRELARELTQHLA